MYSYFSILSYTHNTLLIFCSSIYILPSFVPHPPSKILPATPDSSLHVVQHVTDEVQISPAVPHIACGLMHLNLLAKTRTKLLLVCILFLLSLYNFQFLLGLLYFPREVFDIMYEGLLYGFYGLPFKFSGKVFPVILILLFFSFVLYMPTRLFLSGANKKSFKSKNSVGTKFCQLKVLKVLLMHLFVTLLINKATTGVFSLTHWKMKIRRSF